MFKKVSILYRKVVSKHAFKTLPAELTDTKASILQRIGQGKQIFFTILAFD